MKNILTFLFLACASMTYAQLTPNLDKIDNSVVLIKLFDNTGEYYGHASGFIIDSIGTILTNYHVVEDAYVLKVITDVNGKKSTYEVESVISINERIDLATIRIKRKSNQEFFAPLQLSKVLPKKGEECWAIGTPADPEYMNTVSKGIVSNVYTNGVSRWSGIVIQTNAEITHGSSGGVLVDKLGQAIGVTCGGDATDNGARASINWAVSTKEINNLIPYTPKIVNNAVNQVATQNPTPTNINSKLVSFYTNTNFAGVISIYVDGIYIGKLTESIKCLMTPNCDDNKLLKKPIRFGIHSFSAYSEFSKEWVFGNINVNDEISGCQLVLLNFKKAIPTNPNKKIEIPITLKVEGQSDCEVFLIKYFGSRLNYADTACMIDGIVVFDGKKQKPGIVGLLLPGQKYFEFVYNNEEIHLETKGPDFMANLVIKKSEENKIFIPYVKYISAKKGEANKLAEQRAKLKDTDAEYKTLSTTIDVLNKEVDDYQKSIVQTNPNMLVGKIVKMSLDVVVPELPKNEKGEVIDSNFRYKYYFEHYWDNVDLKTDALVNNPIFHNKLEYYFGKNMMIQHWDTIIKYAFKFCDGLDPKSKMYEYSVGWIASTFGKSQIMGMDKVYIYMLNRYFCTTDPSTGKSPATWVAEDKFEELCKDLKWKMNLVVGAKPYNLILRDTSDTKWLDFYSLKSEYTILYFWDPECGHCKKVTPKLVTLYNEKFKNRNIEVFAVGKGIGKDFESWKKYIRENNMNFINVAVTNSIYEVAKATPEKLVPVYTGEKGKPTTLESLNFQTTYDLYSTPRIFVLDKDKKIIAKNLSISQLEDLMDNLQGKKDLPKLFQEDKEEAEHMQQNN